MVLAEAIDIIEPIVKDLKIGKGVNVFFVEHKNSRVEGAKTRGEEVKKK